MLETTVFEAEHDTSIDGKQRSLKSETDYIVWLVVNRGISVINGCIRQLQRLHIYRSYRLQSEPLQRLEIAVTIAPRQIKKASQVKRRQWKYRQKANPSIHGSSRRLRKTGAAQFDLGTPNGRQKLHAHESRNSHSGGPTAQSVVRTADKIANIE